MTTGKTIALIRWTFVGKVMPLLFNILSRLNHELPDTQAGFRKGNHEEVLICYKIRVYYVSGTMLMWNILFNANNLQRWVVLCIYFSLLPFYFILFFLCSNKTLFTKTSLGPNLAQSIIAILKMRKLSFRESTAVDSLWQPPVCFLEEELATRFSYSCLENPMDTGAWRATVHRVTKNQTQLKW